jgi:hypothetical protein
MEKTAAKEKADWEFEKVLMLDQIKLLQRENERLQDQIAGAIDVVTQSQSERGELESDREKLIEVLKSLLPKIRVMELRCQQLQSILPEPLKERIRPQMSKIVRQEENVKINKLGERLMNVLAVLQEVDRFNGSVNVEQQLLSVDGATAREFNVIYLGLGAAFFLDKSGKNAGFGLPEADGWRWHSRNGLVKDVSEFLDIHNGSSQAKFIRLPVQISNLK